MTTTDVDIAGAIVDEALRIAVGDRVSEVTE